MQNETSRENIELFNTHSRKIIFGVLVAGTLLVAACTSAAPAADTTEPAQQDTSAASTAENIAADFQISLFANDDHEAGEVLNLSDLRGKPAVVNFWFPSCPPCIAEMPDIEASYQSHKGEVEFIGIQLVGLDTAEDGQEFVERLGVNYALGPDETGDIIIMGYKVPGFPTTVFLDSEHRIVRTWTGSLNEEKLEELIQETLN